LLNARVMKIVILRGTGGEGGVAAIGTADGRWLLVNVSAAVAGQLGGAPPSAALRGLHGADVRALVLTSAQVEHAGGLLALRGGAPIALYATPAVFEALTSELPVLPVLQHYCGVSWRVVPVAGDQAVAAFRVDGMPTLEFTAIATRAAQPPHAALRRESVVGDSIALAVHDRASGRRVFYAPGLAPLGELESGWVHSADCLLLDSPTAGGDIAGAVQWLPAVPARHKVVFGGEGVLAPREWGELGVQMAYDGMEIEL
jgi:pyrroloquinoline quinone biosynthesis protein B